MENPLDGGRSWRARLKATPPVNSTFQSVKDRDAMLQAGMTDGMGEGYERLDELIAHDAA